MNSNLHQNILGAIGGTPLIRLNRIARHVASTIYVKPEFLNPGGSIKDRAALRMIEDAEIAGELRPGATIVEATAGNTGIGLAVAAAVKGYKLIVVLPDKMSQAKVQILEAYGAQVIRTRSDVPPDSPEAYNNVADRLRDEIPGAFRPNQFANPSNPHAHYLTTGPEIWNSLGPNIDVLVAGIATGGTISGVSRYLKQQKPEIQVIGADPEGSILSGDTPKPYLVEGIGEDYFPETYDPTLVDHLIRISDRQSFTMARRLAREEGILAGGSSGTALAAALQHAESQPTPKTYVVILPDTGRNYMQKMFDDTWLKEHGLWEPLETEAGLNLEPNLVEI